jgi:hypothetical protein
MTSTTMNILVASNGEQKALCVGGERERESVCTSTTPDIHDSVI